MSKATEIHTPRMPALFVGHGSPMNAIEDSRWRRAWTALGAQLPRPRAILALSAHWYGEGTQLTSAPRPATLHDFGGFPAALYALEYPAPGDPALAQRVAERVAPQRGARATAISLNAARGLDHGAWSVLMHLFPAADIPVVQLSLDARLSPEEHAARGRLLAPLREEGVLILASGNLTHNLPEAFASMRRGDEATPTWATTFDDAVTRALEARDDDFLLRALDSELGHRAHPTPEHFIPLWYALGARRADDSAHFPITGFDLGSLSMRSIIWE